MLELVPAVLDHLPDSSSQQYLFNRLSVHLLQLNSVAHRLNVLRSVQFRIVQFKSVPNRNRKPIHLHVVELHHLSVLHPAKSKSSLLPEIPPNVQLNVPSRDLLANNQSSVQLVLHHPLSVPTSNRNSQVDSLPVSLADFLPSISKDACQVY
jgi:hypothetical protein